MTEGGGNKLKVPSDATENAFLYILWPCFKNTYTHIVVKLQKARRGIFFQQKKTKRGLGRKKKKEKETMFA